MLIKVTVLETTTTTSTTTMEQQQQQLSNKITSNKWRILLAFKQNLCSFEIMSNINKSKEN